MIKTALHHELTCLQQLTADLPDTARQMEIHHHLQAALTLLEQMQITAARAAFSLADVDDGLEGLLELLQLAEDNPLRANLLSGLIASLHRQVQFAHSENDHLLYGLLDEASVP